MVVNILLEFAELFIGYIFPHHHEEFMHSSTIFLTLPDLLDSHFILNIVIGLISGAFVEESVEGEAVQHEENNEYSDH